MVAMTLARNCFAIVALLCISFSSGEFVNLQIISNSSTSIMLRWKSNIKESSKSFHVLLNDAPNSVFEESVENKMYFTEITGLMPNTVYEAMVKICPSTEKDLTKCEQFSKPSAPVSTYPKAPEEFTAVAVDGPSIKFAWTLPNQTFKHLLVVVRASAPNTAAVLKVDPQFSTSIVEGLNALTYYDATMSVENTYEAKSVASKKVLTVLTAPNPPTPEVTHVGDSWMIVSLVPATAGEKLKLTFSVTISNSSGYTNDCFPDEQVSCEFDGLEKGTEYSLVTKACYDKLCSVESQPFNVTTGNTPVAKPTTTTTTATTTTTTTASAAPPVTNKPTNDETSSSAKCFKFENACLILGALFAKNIMAM